MFVPVSIIIPTYNRIEYLPKAINSVFSQTYQNIELLVIDDGSTDGTRELLKSYGQQLIYHYQENRGPAAARNTGMQLSKHNMIAFLDSDDWFAPDKLYKQLSAMQEKKGYLFSHTQEIWYRQGKVLNQKNKHLKRHGDIFEHCLQLCAVSMSTVMLRKELIEEIGGFNENLPCCEDYDYWLRVSFRYPVLLIDEPLTLKEGGRPDQVSSCHRIGMDRYRISSLRNLLDNEPLSPAQRQLAEKELVRKCRIYGQGCLKHNNSDGQHYLDLAAQYES